MRDEGEGKLTALRLGVRTCCLASMWQIRLNRTLDFEMKNKKGSMVESGRLKCDMSWIVASDE